MVRCRKSQVKSGATRERPHRLQEHIYDAGERETSDTVFFLSVLDFFAEFLQSSTLGL